MKTRNGYILVETVVAMGLLSISMLAINTAMRNGILARGHAEDYTAARFLLEKIMTDKELQPELTESNGEGQFTGQYNRFRYEWKVEKVQIPKPPLPPNLSPKDREELEGLFRDFMGKVTVKITWTRAGKEFEAEGQTILPPNQLWQPPKEQP